MFEFEALAPDTDEVEANPTGIWTLVAEFVKGPALLLIRAPEGRWSYAPGRDAVCGADGDASALLQRTLCLTSKAAVGALIAKIGGSTAGVDDAPIFVVGKAAVIPVPKEGGPLFMTINDTFDGMSNNSGRMRVEIQRAEVPATPQEEAQSEAPAALSGAH